MQDIYREYLMQHFKNPHNRGIIDSPTVEIVQKNPMCGDIISMQINVSKNVIEDIKFDGAACAVTTASSSILTDAIKGKTLEEVKNIQKEDLMDMLGIDLTTSRVKCAMLPLEAVKNLIREYESRQKK